MVMYFMRVVSFVVISRRFGVCFSVGFFFFFLSCLWHKTVLAFLWEDHIIIFAAIVIKSCASSNHSSILLYFSFLF